MEYIRSVEINIKDCIGCGICVENCEAGAIPSSLIGYISVLAKIDQSKCTLCGDCIPLCPQGAISFKEV
ncbi:MAG: 4Fe-4S binding protein [Promethearchaeota archaeon]